MHPSGSLRADVPAVAVPDKGLKEDAIGFGSGLAIGLDSTAPAYSLAAVIGIVVATVGLQTPAVLLVAFVPIFLTSLAYKALNQVEPDSGTTFAWVTRTMGPFTGWVSGFIVAMAGILVIGSLADTAAASTYNLFGLEGALDSKVAVASLAIFYIVAMTTLTIIGTELSGRVQVVMVVLQVGALLLFAVVTLIKVWAGDGPATAVDPSLDWLNPFSIPSFGALAGGMLTAVFIYWGWESAVTLCEETKDRAVAPGRAGVASTVILLVTYLLVAFAVLGWLGTQTGELYNDDINVLGDIGDASLGGGLGWIVTLAVLTSALAATQTTILPASRSALSMAARRAAPEVFGRIHPRYRTPWLGTAIISGLAVGYYLPLKFISENFLFDTITALGLLIAFYYAITGLAAPIMFRSQLTRSASHALRLGVLPSLGSVILIAVFVKAVIDFTKPESSYFATEVLGVSPPLLIGLGFMLLGVVLAGAWYAFGDREFFRRPKGPVPPG